MVVIVRVSATKILVFNLQLALKPTVSIRTLRPVLPLSTYFQNKLLTEDSFHKQFKPLDYMAWFYDRVCFAEIVKNNRVIYFDTWASPPYDVCNNEILQLDRTDLLQSRWTSSRVKYNEIDFSRHIHAPSSRLGWWQTRHMSKRKHLEHVCRHTRRHIGSPSSTAILTICSAHSYGGDPILVWLKG